MAQLVGDAVEELLQQDSRGGAQPAGRGRPGRTQPIDALPALGDPATLVAQVAAQRLDPARPLSDTGSLEEDLARWASEIWEHWRRPAKTAMLRAAAGVSDGTPNSCLEDRRAEATVIVGRTRDAPARVPTADQIVDHVIGPMIYRLVFEAARADSAVPRQLVRDCMAVAAAGAASPRGLDG